MKLSIVAITLTSLFLAGCGEKGLDRHFDVDNPNHNKKIFSEIKSSDATEIAIRELYWASSNYSDDSEHGIDFNKQTARQVIINLLNKKIQSNQVKLIEAKRELEEQNERIKADDLFFDSISFSNIKYDALNNKGFFNPEVNATIYNGTNTPMSSLRVLASLYINGDNTPVAESNGFVIFSDGLDAGQKKNVAISVFEPSFTKEGSWKTLAIKKAKSNLVVIRPIEISNLSEQKIKRTSIDSLDKIKQKIEVLESNKLSLEQDINIIRNAS